MLAVFRAFRTGAVTIDQYRLGMEAVRALNDPKLLHVILPKLARMLYEGFGIQVVMGEAGGAIGRRSIAVAMIRGGSVQMQSPARSETEQDMVYLCPAGLTEA